SLNSSSIYVDALDYLHFPLTYMDQFTDSYEAIGSGDTTTGRIEVTADGYGTLILPSGTFNDCLRLQEVRRDTNITDGVISFESNDTFYHYYVNGYPEPLCQVV